MKTFICISIFSSVILTAELDILIAPDTIYVGTLSTISISVRELEGGEYPEFPKVFEQPNLYSVVERKLNNYSVNYVLQIWESGLITIPSISVIIRRHQQDILTLETDIITIPVLSNINNNSSILRNIKPLLTIKIISPYKMFLYVLLFVIGILLAIYLWSSRKNNQSIRHQKGRYKKSIFKETISNLQTLQFPVDINLRTTEEYYLKLSHICRTFLKEEYFIRATEMTSDEIEIYFQSIGISRDLINTWSQANKIADLAKYAGEIPDIEQFKRDKKYFIKIIESFHKIRS